MIPFVHGKPPPFPSWFWYSIAGTDMKRIHLSELCRFGEALRGLKCVVPGAKFTDTTAQTDMFLAHGWLRWMANHDHIPVTLSRDNLLKIQGFLERAMQGEFGDTMTAERYEGICKLIDVWTKELYDEIDRLNVYYVSKVDAYDTDILLSNGKAALPEITVKGMDADSIKSFEEGTRCLALKLPTSAGFQLLRAVEGVMHEFYDVLSGGAPRPKRREMGGYIDALEKLKTIDPKMVDVLRGIKNLQRNPLMHPEHFLEMYDAQITFDVAKSAISTMVLLAEGHKKATTGTP